MPARRWAVASTLLAALGAASPAHRQDAVERAQTLAARADTAGALAVLDSAVRAQPRNAAAWYLRGMILWENARPSVRQGFAASQENIRRLMKADSSIRRAVALAMKARLHQRLIHFAAREGPEAAALFDHDDAVGVCRQMAHRTVEHQETELLILQATDQMQ